MERLILAQFYMVGKGRQLPEATDVLPTKDMKTLPASFYITCGCKNNVVEDVNVLWTMFLVVNFANTNVFISRGLIYSGHVLTL